MVFEKTLHLESFFLKSHFTETGNMWTHLIAAMYVIYFVHFGYYKLDGHDQFDKVC